MANTQIFKWNHGRSWFGNIFQIEWSFFSRFIGLELTCFDGDSDRDVTLFFGCGLFAVWITLQAVLPREWMPKGYDSERTTGIRYFDDGIWWEVWKGDDWHRDTPLWRKGVIHMPWYSGACIRTSKLLKNGEWFHEPRKIDWKELEALRAKQDFYSESFPYQYKLKSGEIQNVTATVTVEEREWRQRWLRWTKHFANVSKTIHVEFSAEVGEETGSWKGGTIGCGYKMQPAETPLECLRRMEKERKF